MEHEHFAGVQKHILQINQERGGGAFPLIDANCCITLGQLRSERGNKTAHSPRGGGKCCLAIYHLWSGVMLRVMETQQRSILHKRGGALSFELFFSPPMWAI